ncbi:cysteine--tRNA ligase [Methanobrevibacter sp. 87.7]|uniref:cysteine--tRNA ligase n=1 Tax=Methanobrevibacter sp. 87.7 TaxID=387957 RepID=UPI000B506F9F|nr:cysteine--tRNA ligase [Methanobrevibacter sp. 87.7]OWT32490.1 cysteine--tRNA ligase [Methanobrevibacter sp. 87.7]
MNSQKSNKHNSLKVYSTLTRRKEYFKPINESRVKFFVCGPTVYNDAHIGHGRTYISFDMIKRYLEYKGYTVLYLQNITDVDDKIINRAKEIAKQNDDLADVCMTLARRYERRYKEDMESLNVKSVNLYMRATDHMDKIIDQIKRLIKKGFAYESENGVYFEVKKFDDFAKLSNRNIDELEGHRLQEDSSKKDPRDFALWKKRQDIKYYGEPVWNSPWGKGRPGWHIEDTAITEEYFGEQYDIHGGGLDLIFPHHDAEIAQMEALSGKKPMVNYWFHTGFLNVNGEKMSKSLGNFITIKDLLKEISPETFRFFVLSTHYRSPIDFSMDSLHQADKSLNKIKSYLNDVDEILLNEFDNEDLIEDKIDSLEATQYDTLKTAIVSFFSAMDDDFNTPKAIASIFKLISDSKSELKDLDINDVLAIKGFLATINDILGIIFLDDQGSSNNNADNEEALLDILSDTRKKLRAEKQYDLSDEIRSRLIDLGYEISD